MSVSSRKSNASLKSLLSSRGSCVSRNRVTFPADLNTKKSSKAGSCSSTVYSISQSIYSHVSDEDRGNNFNYFKGLDNPDVPVLMEHPEKFNYKDDPCYKGKKITTTWQELPEIEGFVDQETFMDCSRLYDDNQNHLYELYAQDVEDLEGLTPSLQKLEAWFYLIIEPFAEGDGWFEREMNYKLDNRYTSSCMKNFRNVAIVSDDVREKLIKFYDERNLL